MDTSKGYIYCNVIEIYVSTVLGREEIPVKQAGVGNSESRVGIIMDVSDAPNGLAPGKQGKRSQRLCGGDLETPLCKYICLARRTSADAVSGFQKRKLQQCMCAVGNKLHFASTHIMASILGSRGLEKKSC